MDPCLGNTARIFSLVIIRSVPSRATPNLIQTSPPQKKNHASKQTQSPQKPQHSVCKHWILTCVNVLSVFLLEYRWTGVRVANGNDPVHGRGFHTEASARSDPVCRPWISLALFTVGGQGSESQKGNDHCFSCFFFFGIFVKPKGTFLECMRSHSEPLGQVIRLGFRSHFPQDTIGEPSYAFHEKTCSVCDSGHNCSCVDAPGIVPSLSILKLGGFISVGVRVMKFQSQ